MHFNNTHEIQSILQLEILAKLKSMHLGKSEGAHVISFKFGISLSLSLLYVYKLWPAYLHIRVLAESHCRIRSLRRYSYRQKQHSLSLSLYLFCLALRLDCCIARDTYTYIPAQAPQHKRTSALRRTYPISRSLFISIKQSPGPFAFQFIIVIRPL